MKHPTHRRARLGPAQREHEPTEKATSLLTGLDLNGFCKDSPLGARSVISLQPAAQAIEAGVQYTFSDVGLVQFVANPPLQRGRNSDRTVHV